MKFMSFYSQGLSQRWVSLRLETSLYLKGVVFWSNCHNNFGKSEEMKVDDFSFQNTPFTPTFGVYASVWMDFLWTFWVLWGLFENFFRTLRALWGFGGYFWGLFENFFRTSRALWGFGGYFWGLWGPFEDLGGTFEDFEGPLRIWGVLLRTLRRSFWGLWERFKVLLRTLRTF